jgi:hypothetical protein
MLGPKKVDIVSRMLVTFIPEDMTDEPFGGRHFKKGMPKEFEPEQRTGP